MNTPFTEPLARSEKATTALFKIAALAGTPEERTRLLAKAEGLKLAASYFEEAAREFPEFAELSPLLGGEASGLCTNCGATLSGHTAVDAGDWHIAICK